MKLLLDSDSSTSGRKCDLLVYSGKLELTNNEFKAEGCTAAVLESQRKKNMRLNRAVWEGLHKAGFEAPAILYLDVGGFVGTVNALVCFDGAFACHQVATLRYPQTAEEFRALLGDGMLIRALSALTNFTAEMYELAKAAVEVGKVPQSEHGEGATQGATPESPVDVAPERVVCLSPPHNGQS
ncbi:hypothetical protein BGZ94_005388 [Podila epigama]|nr:hypothetical protein BGZ94_005388 [Podila epigama]